MIKRKSLVLPITFLTLGTAFMATPAFCEDAAPRATKSDDKSNIINPHLDANFTTGEIKQSSLPVTASVGGRTDDQGNNGGSASLEAYKPLIIFGDSGSNPYSGNEDKGGLINLELGGKLAVETGKQTNGTVQVTRSQIEGPRLGLGTYQLAHRYFPDSKNPDQTFRLDGPSVAFHKNENKPLGYSEKSADFEWVKLGYHGAYKVNGVNVDHCIEVAGVTKVGEIDISNQRGGALAGTRISACTGVQLGSVGNLSDQISFTALSDGKDDARKVIQLSNTVALKNIANSPIGVSWTNQKELSESSGPDSEKKVVNTNLFHASVAF